MEQLGSAPRWRFLLSPRWLAWHAFAVVAFWGMCWLGDWQLHRALSGNSLSWAYTFEWPMFAVMGAYFWAKTIRDEFRLSRDEPTAEAAWPVGAEAVHDAPCTEAARGALVPAGCVSDAAAEPDDVTAQDAYLARLVQEVRRHGRWHGLR
jgi:hypothetical protein